MVWKVAPVKIPALPDISCKTAFAILAILGAPPATEKKSSSALLAVQGMAF